MGMQASAMAGYFSEARDGFPSTHWSEVQGVTGPAVASNLSALDRLLSRYHGTVVRYLVYKFCLDRPEAEDYWQAFVVGRILEKQFLTQADPDRGRFRAFLLRSLDRFVISELRRGAARKRSPGQELVSMDAMSDEELPRAEVAAGEDSESLWAQAVIAGALLNMRLDCQRSDCMSVWGVFEGRILSAILEDAPPISYTELVQRFGFRSPTQAFNALGTAKRMFKRHLQQVIAEYAADDRAVEEELSELRMMLRRFS
jgi:DNA-directed RNA polymerase specialized sigma24 family protein